VTGTGFYSYIFLFRLLTDSEQDSLIKEPSSDIPKAQTHPIRRGELNVKIVHAEKKILENSGFYD
jgi:hypothetical protein